MKQTKEIPLPEDWQTMPVHPLAELTEFGAGVDVEAVADEMKLHGYDSRESLVFYEGKLFDGRLRRTAAIKADVAPSACEFIGSDPIAFARRKLLRQHLSISQRSMFAATLANLKPGQHKDDAAQSCAADSETHTRAEAAKSVDVSPRAVDFASVVEKHGSSKLKRAVNVGILKVSDAAKVARKPKAVQDYACKEVQEKRAKTAVEAATLCDRCQKRLTKKGEPPTANCVVCRDKRENPKAKKAPKKKAKPTPEPESPSFAPATVLSAAANGLYEFIDKTPPLHGWPDHPDQKKLKGQVDELVADLEAWVRRLAGHEAKLFEDKRGQYGH